MSLASSELGAVPTAPVLKSPHLLSILDLDRLEAEALLDYADTFVELNRQPLKKRDTLLEPLAV